MAASTIAAPATPGAAASASPQIDGSALVHAFSHLAGDVRVASRVRIAPGASIRADAGSPFSLGEGSSIEDGVVMHGLQKGRVVGDDGKEYSIWIGRQTCLAHLSLIHGPAYIGDGCFIGFRSTVFNARVGAGSIVMMHTLIQDVEIPPGKYVPSGAVITNQQQADRLPDVQERDLAFARHVTAMSESFPAQREVRLQPTRSIPAPSETPYENLVETMTISTDIRSQVRSLLAQGYAIAAEYADQRRFKTNSWLSCGAFSGSREEQILADLEACLQEHAGAYVRLLGIDTKAKRRAFETVVQRPGESAGTATFRASSVVSAPSHRIGSSNGNISADVVSQVRSLLHQGCKIGIEYADKRRFRTGSWLTGPKIESFREADAIRELEAILADLPGEYVRLVGIDPAAKRRVIEVVIQRPGETPNLSSSNGSAATSSYRSPRTPGATAGSAGLSGETISQVRSLLAQGYKIGSEHADKRRFRTGSWQTCSPIESNRESDVIAALETCLAEHQGEYVRLLGIDFKVKRRVLEAIIQRPEGQNGSSSSSASAPATAASYSTPKTARAKAAGSLSSEVMSQVRSLLAQGYKIGSEHADKRRFRTSSWQSCSPIESNRESDVIAALETCLTEHQGEYVRLLGIDSKAKRRVLETLIQRP